MGAEEAGGAAAPIGRVLAGPFVVRPLAGDLAGAVNSAAALQHCAAKLHQALRLIVL
jgi:hypothetical protein